MNKELKTWINSNLIRKDGRLNTNYFRNNILETKFPKQYKQIVTSNDISTVEQIYRIMNDITETPKCGCGENRVFNNFSIGYRDFCGNKCNYTKQQILSRIEETNIKKYGVKCVLQDKDVKDKIKKTNIKKYGYEYYFGTDEGIEKSLQIRNSKTPEEKQKILEKRQKTNIERFGVDNIRKSKDYIEKHSNSDTRKQNMYITQKTNYYNKLKEEIYNDDYHLDLITTLDEFLVEDEFQFQCKECQKVISVEHLRVNGVNHSCNICYPRTSNTTQMEVFDYINNKDDVVHYEDRTLLKDGRYSKEIDIYNETKKFGIEYNGLMWHSTGKDKSSKFDNYYLESTHRNRHINKTEACEEKGVQLFHIFENEWLDETKKNIWLSVLDNKMNKSNKIFARKTTIKEVESKEARNFLELNHLQGHVNSTIKVGLYYNDELVSLMTFGKSRYNKDIDYELLRFCNKLNNTVVGGASKLLKYFERNYKPKNIISYANRRWSTGSLYESLDFDFVKNTKPNYFYFLRSEYVLHSRIKFQKHKLKDLLEVFDENETETINMYNNDYRKIFDCGNKVYIKEF